MIPRPASALGDIAMKVLSLAGETSSSYAMANAGMIAMLLQALAQHSETAVAARMTDIDELHELFRSARAAPDGQPRAAFCEKTPRSLMLADIDALHAEGLRLLIELHGWAETAAPELDAKIWAFLARHTERHKLEL